MKRVETGVLSGPMRCFHEYTYTAGLRTAAATERGDWSYQYSPNGRGELIGGTKHTGSGPAPGYAFAYDFDEIGNRRSHTKNGNATSYVRTSLNQYDSRSNPGVLEVSGASSPPRCRI